MVVIGDLGFAPLVLVDGKWEAPPFHHKTTSWSSEDPERPSERGPFKPNAGHAPKVAIVPVSPFKASYPKPVPAVQPLQRVQRLHLRALSRRQIKFVSGLKWNQI